MKAKRNRSGQIAKLGKEAIAKCLELLKTDKTYAQIAAECGIGEASVNNIRRRANVPPRREGWAKHAVKQYAGPDYPFKARPRTEAETRMRRAMQGLSNWPAMARRAY